MTIDPKVKRNLLLGSGIVTLGYSAYKMENKLEFVGGVAVGAVGFGMLVGAAWGGGNKITNAAIPFMIMGSASYIITRGIFQKNIPTSLTIATICGGLFFAYEHYKSNKPRIDLKSNRIQQNTQPIQSKN